MLSCNFGLERSCGRRFKSSRSRLSGDRQVLRALAFALALGSVLSSPFLALQTTPAVAATSLTLYPTSLVDAEVDNSYLQHLSTSSIGGVAPYVYSVTSGSLPAGLSLSGSTIRGTPTTVGTSTFTIQVRDQNAMTTSRTYTLEVDEVYDPTADSQVTDLVTAQTGMARQFADQQMANIINHQNALHNSLQATPPAILPKDDGNALTGTYSGSSGNNGAGYTPDGFQRIAFWTGGSISFQSANLSSSETVFDGTSATLSSGMDVRVRRNFFAGASLGGNFATSNVSDEGTQAVGQSINLTGYTSWQPVNDIFIDTMGGYGKVWIDTSRYISANGLFADGLRDGDQVYAAMTTSIKRSWSGLTFSPFGRFQASHSWLKAYSETGPSTSNLEYGAQSLASLTGRLGFNLNYLQKMEWGELEPRISVEYAHEFADTSSTPLKRLTTNAAWRVEESDAESNFATVGLGTTIRSHNGKTQLSLDYGATIDAAGISRQPLWAHFSHNF